MCFNVGMSNPESYHPDYNAEAEQAMHDAAARREAMERHLKAVPDLADSLTEEQRELDPDFNEAAVQAELGTQQERLDRIAKSEIAAARAKQDQSRPS